ncbi:MAG: MerR family transcriptional regulator [Bacteroidota bacterium]|nr:MerR family transcriptional regulator [Bacteroidota bacterium]MDP4196268.1 MerR family transcriptional regulator [Bacteroidota bacterium]
MEKEQTYPIKAVSKLTGLSSHVIRAWEKRYHAVSPKRTKSERREYSKQDLEKLTLLAQVVLLGYSIGSIAGLAPESLKKIIEEHSGTHEAGGKTHMDTSGAFRSAAIEYLDTCIQAIRQYEPFRLQNILLKALLALGQERVINELVIPLIKDIGEGWESGELRIPQEHMASSVITEFLKYIISLYRPAPGAPVVISASVQGQMHELGALLVSVTAASMGWKTLHLGANLPAEEINKAALDSGAKVVCISLVYPSSDEKTKEELKQLAQLTSHNIKVIAGGRAAKSYSEVIDSSGMLLINEIDELRKQF